MAITLKSHIHWSCHTLLSCLLLIWDQIGRRHLRVLFLICSVGLFPGHLLGLKAVSAEEVHLVDEIPTLSKGRGQLRIQPSGVCNDQLPKLVEPVKLARGRGQIPTVLNNECAELEKSHTRNGRI